MKTFISKILTMAIISGAGFFMLSGCKTSNADTFAEKQKTIRPVKGFQIKKKDDFVKHSFPAVIAAETEIRLSFRVGGPIVEMSLETGQKIKKGELLAKIDERDFLLKIKNIKANLDASYAELKDAKLQYERYKSLVKENAAAKAKFDQVEAAYKSISLKTEGLEKQLENAKNALEDTNLYTPVSGYVNQLFTENHEAVATGQPVLSIVNIDTVEVKANISENLVTKSDSFDNFTFSLNSAPEKTFSADLKEIGEKATGAGNTYPLILKASPQSIIKPGMSAVVSFTTPAPEKNDIFTIPLSAVISKDYENPILWKIDTEKNTPLKTYVKTYDLISSDKIKVSGDLNQGDWIVTAGAFYINENSKIKLMPSFSRTNYGNEL